MLNDLCSVGGSSGTVGVLRTNTPAAAAGSIGSLSAAAGGAVPAGDDYGSSSWQDDPHVQQLVQYGYPAEYVMAALQSYGGNCVRALHHLQQQLLAGNCQVQQDSADAPTYASHMDAGAALPDSWADEVEVLAAIYGDELDSSVAGVIKLQVGGGDQVRAGRPTSRRWGTDVRHTRYVTLCWVSKVGNR